MSSPSNEQDVEHVLDRVLVLADLARSDVPRWISDTVLDCMDYNDLTRNMM